MVIKELYKVSATKTKGKAHYLVKKNIVNDFFSHVFRMGKSRERTGIYKS
jgi:hypothetical protein